MSLLPPDHSLFEQAITLSFQCVLCGHEANNRAGHSVRRVGTNQSVSVRLCRAPPVGHRLHRVMTLVTEPVPRVPADSRTDVDDLGYGDDGITHVTARFGYMERPDVPRALAQLGPDATEGPLDLDRASYFLSKIELRRGTARTMAPWRKRLFIATSYVTADAAEFFNLPRDRTVIMGSNIDV